MKIINVLKKAKADFDMVVSIKRKKLIILLAIITFAISFVSIYFGLVPLNFNNTWFRVLVGLFLLLWSIPLFINDRNAKKRVPFTKSFWQIPFYLLCTFIVVTILSSLITSTIFMSDTYRNMIDVHDNQSFIESVEDYSTMQIPVVDKGLAVKLGEKKLGEDNLGSQYNVGEYYMICHNETLYWIAPIEYNGFFPWANQRVCPGYVMINANNQSDVQIIKDELIYTDSAYFWEDLNRKNYFNNLTAWRANEAHLELTDEGKPMFVDTVYVNRLGYTNCRDVCGIIVTDPKTGESTYYDYLDAPTWINHVITEDVAVEQLSWWGTLVNGYFNSVFAKNAVLEVSTGLNYVYSNGNMYLQTGMTSVGGDESIVGVMMVDMRTKKASFARIGGATEYAAAQSAIGKEQAMRYTASDPIMINLQGMPTYFLMLKDDEGLVKKYAYVNVADYNIVATASTKEDALLEHKKLISVTDNVEPEEYEIEDIRQVIAEGNTYYYLKLKDNPALPSVNDKIFSAPVSVCHELPFLKEGDLISITYTERQGLYIINSLNVK
ncbi:MAG: hypothetical protein IJF76_05090 [Clostridia bacterium]|nr:hypothetical protein [Clostridia bacterium]